MNPIFLQTLYLLGGAIVLPFLPFLFWQGRRVSRLRHAVGKSLASAEENVFYFDEAETVDERFSAAFIRLNTVTHSGRKR